jgi:hypothetical protein
MTWMAQPIVWILLGVGGGVALGVVCLFWASQGKPLSENPHHD